MTYAVLEKVRIGDSTDLPCRAKIWSERLYDGSYHWLSKCEFHDRPLGRSSTFPRALATVTAHQWLTASDEALERFSERLYTMERGRRFR